MTSGEPIGKFQVLGTLGTGAHSTILQVRRQADSRQYALKVVPIGDAEEKKFLEQAEHEFHVSQKLDHPNLVKIYALEQVKDWMFRVKKAHLLIEFVNGKTLDEVPPLSLPKLVRVMGLIAAGLAHMHRCGVVHADMKPNNVMLSRAGDVKIIDYGLAWVKGEPKGRVQGTPEYMAPETVRKKLINERTDIFNFGATMYRLVTLRLPPSTLGDENMPADAELWQRQLKPVQEIRADCPKELADIIHRCLSFNAMKRPETMKEVQENLEQIDERLDPTGSGSHKVLEW
ncbi:MAG TPA: serine/threonine-protein kinase [Gemmataceae bacterium]|nr:serine/threonine-protein kinase [Gemmataceae bacterium]